MIVKLILILTSFCFGVKGGVLFDSKLTVRDSCVTLSIPEEDFKLLRKISGRLDTFLERNLEAGHQNLKKVLSAFGVDKDVVVKVDSEAPLENVLLQHQLTFHQDVKRMFLELKNLFLGLRSPNFIPKANNDLFSFGSFGSSISKISTLKPNLKSIIQDKTNASQKTSGGGWGISPYFGDRHFYLPTDSTFRPTDCSEILVAGDTKSGIYQIYPFRCQCSRPVEVFCDMETDGGGWTVFLSRVNVSKPINFTRNWADYKKGFGMPGEEHWLGNENVHILSHHRNYILRMEVKDGFGREIWGEWNVFKVDSEEMKYKLTATNYNAKSTAYDRFSYVNGNYFSTFDMDNDKSAKTSCAVSWKGGWWYNNCHNNNPTGLHAKKDSTGMRIKPWSKLDSTERYATWLQLKIRPQICSNSISVAKLNTHNCAFD